MVRLLSASIAWLLLVTGCLAADWPQFRGADAKASVVEPLPTDWNGDANVLWKVKLPGPGASSPITFGDRVYITCYTGFGTLDDDGNQEDLVRHLVCLDKRDGREIWKCDLKTNTPEARFNGMMTQHGYASNTPATDGQRIYVFLGTGGVVAVGLDGKEVWRTPVGQGTDGWGSGSSVVLTDDLVIVSAAIESQSLVALNKSDGKEKWRVEIPKRSWSTPALVKSEEGRVELVVSGEGKISAFDPTTGGKLWHCTGIGDYTCPSVIPGKGVVYISGGRRTEIIAVRAGGSGDVTDTHILWRKRIWGNVTTPLLHGEYLFGVSDRAIAYCVEAKTGEIRYQARLANGEAVETPPDGPGERGGPGGRRGEGGRDGGKKGEGDRGGPGGGRGRRGAGGFGFGGGGMQLYASVVAAGDNLYAVTRTDGTFVLAAEPKFRLVGTSKIDADKSRFDATPAISDGHLYLRSNEAVYCIGKKP